VEGGPWWEAPKAWSPDGHRLLIESAFGDTYGAAIVDIDGHRDPVVPSWRSMDEWFAAWSPDGTEILWTTSDASGNSVQQQLWDTKTGASIRIHWTGASYPSWQRIGLP
jgi:Tol biopolymer transport system component